MDCKRPHVLIIGAGLGGLTLAQGLRKHGITYEIFERDDGPDSRRQGWAIGLHSVLEELQKGVPADLTPLTPAVNHLQPLKLAPQFIMFINGIRLGVTGGPESFVLRASRVRLRAWLATNIPITYGKHATGIEESDAAVTVHFQDGTSASGDVIVGADGINSRVVIGETTLTGAKFERQLSLSHSAYLAVSDDRTLSLFVGLNRVSEDGTVGYYYWFFMIPDTSIDEPGHWTKHASKAERYEKALQGASALRRELTEIIKLTPVDGIRTDFFSFRDAEINANELPQGRITLLGDAAHPMAPFRGEGGVHAIRDALNLTTTLATSSHMEGTSILSAVASYQKEMMARGVEAVRQSRGQVRADRRPDEPWMIWGHAARPTTEARVKIEDWL